MKTVAAIGTRLQETTKQDLSLKAQGDSAVKTNVAMGTGWRSPWSMTSETDVATGTRLQETTKRDPAKQDRILKAKGDSAVKTNVATGTRLEETTKQDLAQKAQGDSPVKTNIDMALLKLGKIRTTPEETKTAKSTKKISTEAELKP